MSRQMRLVAAVFALATLMLLFFRSSLWDAQQVRMPAQYEEKAAQGDEEKQRVVQVPVEGGFDGEAEFRDEGFELGLSGGLKELAPGAKGSHSEDAAVDESADVALEGLSPEDLASVAPVAEAPVGEAPAPEDPAPEAPAPEAPAPEAPAPEEPTPEEPHPQPPSDPKPEEPVPFSDIDTSAPAPDELAPEAPQVPTPEDEAVPFSDIDTASPPLDEPDTLAFPAQPKPPSSEATSAPAFDPTSDDLPIDWSRFAYTQYVTDSDYLCNSVMIFEALHRLGSKPDKVMMYPRHMFEDPDADAASVESSDARLIVKARDEYGVKVVPIEIEHRDNEVDDTWADSYTKLLAFNQTQYSRVLSLDSDSTILHSMDELFLMPPVPVAMPRAYWLLNDAPPKKVLSSQLILLEPSASEYTRIKSHIDDARENEYDMEIVNELYLDSAMVLPHRPYDMLSAEFRRTDHRDYLGSEEQWDPVKIYNEAKMIHFSDWPVPKPWMKMDDGERVENQPECTQREGKEDCTERELWNKLYEDFWERRQTVCNVGAGLA